MVRYLGLVLTGTLLAAIPARGASFQGLGDLPGGAFNSSAASVSGNGSVVVGSGCNATWWPEAYRWTAEGGMEGLGLVQARDTRSYATDTSEDGSVVVGYSGQSVLPFQLFRWTRETGMAGLGGQTDLESWAAVSGDGTVIAGTSQKQAFRWTETGGAVGLGDLPGGIFDSFAYDISSDGSVVVGGSISASGCEVFRWTAGEGMVGLGDLGGGGFGSVGRCVSGDGLVIGGWSESDLGTEACVWRDGVIEGLGGPEAGHFWSEALGISGDGSVVVGCWAATGSAPPREAFIWDARGGIRDLKAVLTGDYGLDLSGWMLGYASGISADGRTIVGVGANPGGQNEAWVATIPEPGTVVLMGLGAGLASRKWKGKRQERRERVTDL